MIKKTIESFKNEGFIKTIQKIYLAIYYWQKAFRRNFIFFFHKLKARNGRYLKTIHGNRMLLNINDVGISKELILTGIHEKNSTAYFKTIIKEGMQIGEFGANIGYYALLASNLVGNNGKIYAFEPSPVNFKELEQNIALNKKESYFNLINKGIGAENTVMKFYISTKGNMSSFIEREESGEIKNIEVIDVQVIKADDYFKDKPLDFVRMDVEGFETDIIKGMHEILSRPGKPAGLFIEVHSELLHRRNSSAGEFVKHLAGYGYEVEKAFYRGRADNQVSSTAELLNHKNLEKGYWEAFFSMKTDNQWQK
ncbi:MAG: FkbM family methyltransferase [Bacteroidales bacterium]